MIEKLDCEARITGDSDSTTTVSRVSRRTSGYVVLDTTWARRLGVRRSGGRYRITRRELMERLRQLQPTPLGQAQCPSTVPSRSHFVAISETEVLLVQSVRDFLAPGLATGGPAGVAVMIATETRRLSVDRALREAGIDVPQAHRCNRLVARWTRPRRWRVSW